MNHHRLDAFMVQGAIYSVHQRTNINRDFTKAFIVSGTHLTWAL